MTRSIVSFVLSLVFIICIGNNIKANPVDNSALVVIDVQKAFSEPDGFSPVCREQADGMLPVINKLIQTFSDTKKDIIYIKQEYVRDTQFDSRLKILSTS